MTDGTSSRLYSSIAVGGSVNGSLGGSGYDLYQITLVAGRTYRIDLNGWSAQVGTLLDPVLALRDATGQLIIWNDDASGGTWDSRLTYIPTTTATYLIDASGGTSGTYWLAVRDVTPLQLISSPDNAVGVATSPVMTLTFSESIAAGVGNIVIRRASDGLAVRTIAVGDASQVAISGNTLTITPTQALAENTAYYVTMPAGIVHGLPGNAFAGIATATVLNFKTGDFTAPTLVKATPADGMLGVAPGANVVLTFSEAVKAGAGSFRIYDAAGDALVWQASAATIGQVTFAGNTVTLNPPLLADMQAGHSYYVIVDSNAVTDLAGLAFAGISAPTALNFTVRDGAAPTLVAASPADNATLVPVGNDVVLTFSENVIAGTGNIVIRRASDNVVVRTIAVGDTSQVTFAGSSVTINPTADLADGTAYYVTMAAGVIRDVTGSNYAGLTLSTQLNFTTGDVHAPLLVSTAPADNVLGIAPGANIVLRFNETVKSGAGNISIWNTDGTLFRAMRAADTTQVTIAGSLVTINPIVNLIAGASYSVTVDANALTDRFGNAFAGIADPTALNFTVSDLKAPLLLSATPSNRAIGVVVGADIVLTFNEAVIAGAGNILIRRAVDNVVVQTIAVGDTSQVTFAGNVVTINPMADLAEGTNYYVSMAAGVITDLSGTKYAGLTLPTQLGFQTQDIHAPLLVATSPADNAINVAVGANLVLTFNETVKAGTGTIKIWRADGTLVRSIAATDTTQVTVVGKAVTINPLTDLSTAGVGYYVTVDAGAFKDRFNNAFAGIADATSFSFTTRDTVAPKLVASTPADNALAIHPASNIVLTFNEAVQVGTGNIVIRTANGTIARTIAIGDTSQVTVVGSTVTINPTADLADLTSYNVQMAAGVIKDLAGNAFAGITTATALNFTTKDTTAPTLTSTTPTDDAINVAVGSNIVLTFNEAVKIGTGNIEIHSADGSLFWSADVAGPGVTISGATVTLDPPNDLAPETGYYVTIGSGVLTDLAGNAFAGIAPSTAFNFRTTDTHAPTLLSMTPADGTNHVAPGANIVLNFSEDIVAAGFFGPLYIVRYDGSVAATISATDTSQVTISGSTVTINPNADLASGQSYYLDTGISFMDLSGNYFNGLNWVNSPGFTIGGLVPGDDFTDWIDTTGVVAVGGTAQGNIDVDTDYDWFKVHLEGGTTYDITEVSIGRTGGVNDPYLFGIYDSTGTYIPGTYNDDFDGKDSRVVFTPTSTGDYFIEATSYGTNTGIYEVGVAVHGSALVDTTAPTLIAAAPLDNATGVDPLANITLRFSEVVVAGTGNIVLTADGGVDTRTIGITDTSQVTVNNGTLTINPTAALAADTHYAVTLDAGAITDLAGNAYAGITDPQALDFYTAAGSATDAWTIMIYIAGDNNLETFGIADINEMEQANLPDNVNVVFLFDRTGGYDTTNGNWTDTRVGAVIYDGTNSAISSSLTSWGEMDTGSGATLTQFLDWGTTNYTANHYGLVVWDHGSGLDGVAWDNTSGDNLSLSELRGAITQSTIGHLDFVGFDACLQAMTEQVFHLRAATDVVIASEELVPGPGWAYDRWLGSLGSNPGMTTTELASAIVTSYGDEYAGQSGITLSATSTAALGNLETSLDAFVAAALALPATSADWTAMRTEASLSHFYPSDDATYRYRDLGDFMQGVASHVSNSALSAAAGDVVTALDAAVVAQTGSVADATGLSIYLPYDTQSVRSDYTAANFTFLSQVAWDSYLGGL